MIPDEIVPKPIVVQEWHGAYAELDVPWMESKQIEQLNLDLKKRHGRMLLEITEF